MDKDPNSPRTESIQRRLDHSADLVLKHFLFVEEAPLTDRMQGVSGFAEQFTQRGPRDKRGRSLRDFNRQTRIFQYPCSYTSRGKHWHIDTSPTRQRVNQSRADPLAGASGLYLCHSRPRAVYLIYSATFDGLQQS